MKTVKEYRDKNRVVISLNDSCEAYNEEANTYFNGEVVGVKDGLVSVEDMDGDVFDIEPYNIKVELDLRDIAEQEELKVIETTIGSNGYPKSLKYAIVGFETFEQARDLAEKYNLNVESFKRKDGWQLWNRDNATRYVPYQNTALDFGDDYEELYKMDEDDFFESEVNHSIDNFTDFESLETFLKDKKQVWKEIENMEDDEIVITCCGEYYDTIKKESMEFSHDTWNYIIGVI